MAPWIKSTAAVAVLAATAPLVAGSSSSSSYSSYNINHKDDSYYNANHGNPNVNLKMYWKDAENVIMDLSLFSSLHVKFHQCVWTGMQQSSPGYQYVDNDVDENDYWYMGSVPPMGANVAFTLYGSLKGESFSGCNSDTFINSFYTTTGFDDFVEAMNFAGQSGFSSYAKGYYNQIYDNGGDDRRERQLSYKNGKSSLTAYCQGGYGVGCDYNYGFAVHQYKYNECNPQNATYVLDDLSDLNYALEKSDCVRIWNGGSSYSSGNSDYSSYGNYENSKSAVELLYHSKACSFMNYWSPDGGCPDPYNKVYYYLQNYNQGIKRSWPDPYADYEEAVVTGKKRIRQGIMLCAIAFVVMLFECFRPRPKQEDSPKEGPSYDSRYRQDPDGTPIPEGTYDQPQIHVTGEDPSVTYRESDQPTEDGGSRPYVQENPSGIYNPHASFAVSGAMSMSPYPADSTASYPNDPYAQQALAQQQQHEAPQLREEDELSEDPILANRGVGTNYDGTPVTTAAVDKETDLLGVRGDSPPPTQEETLKLAESLLKDDPIGEPIETQKSADSALYATGTVWHHDPPPLLNEGLQYKATANLDDLSRATTPSLPSTTHRQPPFPEQAAPKPTKTAHFEEDDTSGLGQPKPKQPVKHDLPTDPLDNMGAGIL